MCVEAVAVHHVRILGAKPTNVLTLVERAGVIQCVFTMHILLCVSN